ncbi:hypothetical protein AB0D11_40610 [Streptomyces monashensis]
MTLSSPDPGVTDQGMMIRLPALTAAKPSGGTWSIAVCNAYAVD